MKTVLCLLALCIVSPLISSPLVDQQIIISAEKNVEYFLLKPEGNGPFPVMFLLHAYQHPEISNGGKELVETGYLERFTKQGIVAVAISVPGYGKSTGPRDFCGHDSQDAVIAVINHIKNLSFIDGSKMGIYAYSRAVPLAAMVSSRSPSLSIQILESGFYDLIAFKSNSPDYMKILIENILDESGGTNEDLKERSPIYHSHEMKAATLILQGELDDRRQLPYAQKFNEQLQKQGVETRLVIYPEQTHYLSPERWETIIPFVRKHFFDLYGIGINITRAKPAFQILKKLPNTPAAKLDNLKVGDAILSISPQNDETEIPVLRMPQGEFVSLLLGKKDSEVRLHIQHFDFSTEDIVIKRG